MKAIKFNTEMVRAVLDGGKTQTRRPIKFDKLSKIKKGRLFYSTTFDSWAIEDKGDNPEANITLVECPCGKVGDRLEVDGESITLEITGIRVERVQEITGADIVAEGVKPRIYDEFDGLRLSAWINLWDSIYKPKGFGWDTNCYVWVISFKVLTDKEA